MATVEQQILWDLLVVALIAFILGLFVHAWLRRRNPEQAWGTRGNVWTQPFSAIDLPVVALLLGLFLVSVWSSGSQGEGVDDGTQIGMQQAWLSIVLYIFLLSSLFFFLGFIRMKNVVEIFGLDRLAAWKIVLIAVVSMVVVYPIVFGVAQAANVLVLKDTFEGLERQEVVRVFAEASDPALRFVLVLSACVVAPVAEEFLFRGYIYPVVKRFTDMTFSVLFTSIVFAVVHVNVLSLAPLIALALCFTLAYELTGCLWVPIAMHAIFNIVNVMVILMFPELL